MNRNLKISQIFGQFYVAFVLIFITAMYCDIYHVFQPDFFSWDKKGLANVYFLTFNALFIMLVWSLIRSMISDPGKIPHFWVQLDRIPFSLPISYDCILSKKGLYLDDPEHKKRRYCLICHIFKPERCHHCSICGRCVLNMDHHCPWLNNCIGYQNRKFFILLIFYVNVTVWFVIGGLLPFVYQILNTLHTSKEFSISSLFVLVPFMILTPFSFVIFKFFHFHLTLLSHNLTTLEHMDRERNKEPIDKPSPFDIGLINNLEQVFGSNKLLWPFPLFGESGKPIGGGVTFRHRNDIKSTENKENPDQSNARKKTNDQNDESEPNSNETSSAAQLTKKGTGSSLPQYKVQQMMQQSQQSERQSQRQNEGQFQQQQSERQQQSSRPSYSVSGLTQQSQTQRDTLNNGLKLSNIP